MGGCTDFQLLKLFNLLQRNENHWNEKVVQSSLTKARSFWNFHPWKPTSKSQRNTNLWNKTVLNSYDFLMFFPSISWAECHFIWLWDCRIPYFFQRFLQVFAWRAHGRPRPFSPQPSCNSYPRPQAGAPIQRSQPQVRFANFYIKLSFNT